MHIKKIIIVSALLVTGVVTYALLGHTMLHPVIKNYGPVYDVPFAKERPDSAMEYKIVADCGELTEKPIENPAKMYAPFQHIARMYNLHIYGGVQQKNLDAAVVIWGDPTPIILNNESYRKKYGTDNPNIEIISEMKQAGIKFYACGQSIMKLDIDPADINPDVTVAVSRFTAVSTFQLTGYAYFKF